jgi:predicted phage baseplate assembly protein
LQLKGDGLINQYDPTTVAINANVVAATQGESVKNEVLGSGDATQAFQSFTLRQSPLTYVQAPTKDGKASTLSISVDGIAWQEVDTFYGHGPYDRIYVTSIGDDQKVTVQFGDGSTGARLPTGEDNVIASYRTGSGSKGIIKPGQVSLLKTQPLGVKGISNPVSPTGAVDPDTMDDARRNADNTVRTLGRIVSVSDYETYAYSYAAVAKARATLIWNNQARAVYVTIAGPPTPEHAGGTTIERGSGIYNKIYSGMRQHSDPIVPFFLLPYTTPFFRLAAQVKVQPDFAPESVLQAVDQAVRAAFSFDARAFGQPVYLKEVIAATQPVPGVVTIHLYAFYRRDNEPDHVPGPDNNLPEDSFLPAALPTLQKDGNIIPAELLLIDPAQPFYKLEEMP